MRELVIDPRYFVRKSLMHHHWSLRNISNTGDRVLPKVETPIRELKIGPAMEYFWPMSRCLEMWWNVPERLIYISNKTKTVWKKKGRVWNPGTSGVVTWLEIVYDQTTSRSSHVWTLHCWRRGTRSNDHDLVDKTESKSAPKMPAFRKLDEHSETED